MDQRRVAQRIQPHVARASAKDNVGVRTQRLLAHYRRARKDAECESLPRVPFREEGYSPLFLNASAVKLISGFETPMQVTTSCGHDEDFSLPDSSNATDHQKTLCRPEDRPV